MSELEIYQRALTREKQARLEAEQLLESSTRQLYQKNQALKQQQAAMLKNEKLATIGLLSAGVAHEINNPLAVVISNLNALASYNRQLLELLALVQQWHAENQLPPAALAGLQQLNRQTDFTFMAEDAPEMMVDMQDGLHRVQDIVSNLKSFSRTQPGERQTLDINACLRASVKLVSNAFKADCLLQLELDPLPETQGNNSELSQVFMNLLINAAHACRNNAAPGEVILRSKVDSVQQQIEVQIEDNGCGIPDRVIQNIFNPFFTTKPPGEGTGMGLAVAHGIINDHNGTLLVNSAEGVGTCFTLHLPIVTVDAARAPG